MIAKSFFAASIVLAVASAAAFLLGGGGGTKYYPLVIADGGGFRATLHRDGRWTVEGDPEKARKSSRDVLFSCVLDRIIGDPPPLPKWAPNDSGPPMSKEEMDAVIKADPRIAPCMIFLSFDGESI